MRKYKFFVIFFFLATILSVSVIGQTVTSNCRHVAAPLDGGLLTVLGAAGIAYFVARKKKKNLDV